MITAILTDIEGTCTSLSFVKDTLFPYAREHIVEFVSTHRQQPEIRAEIEAVTRILSRPDMGIDEVCAQLTRWIDEDKKITPLKTLQGYLWQEGYEKGDYRAHIYPDAREKFLQWHEQGLGLYVYSSGSIKAQQLLFRYSEYGDLSPLFSGFFDTTSGAKTEPQSYQGISREIGKAGEQILFLSDVEAELDAAMSAGLQTVCLQRENALTPHSKHRCAADFREITPV